MSVQGVPLPNIRFRPEFAAPFNKVKRCEEMIRKVNKETISD
jgi:hypothetical protein